MMGAPEFETFQMLPGLILSRHFRRNMWDEDLLQEGRLELWRCIQDYGVVDRSFFNYAYTRILHLYARQLSRSGREILVGDLDHLPELAAEEDLAEWMSLQETISRILKKCPRQAEALKRKAAGMSYRQIGMEMGVSASTARRLCRKGAAALRERGTL